MKSGKRVTITEVAKESGTSIATVSRVLNDSDYPVSRELRERIWAAVRKLNYTPGNSTINVQRNCARDIGVLVPNISNPFYAQALLGIESVLSEKGYNILLFNTLRSIERERKCLQILRERQVRGAIISTVEDGAEDLAQYIEQGMQFVLLDQEAPSLNCPSIHFDSSHGAKLAMEYLFRKGHSQIAFATTPMVRATRIDTYRGYCESLAAANLPYRADFIFQTGEEPGSESRNYELDAGAGLARQFLDSKCSATAILCVNDMLAIGMINALTEHGVRVPEDVSVVGFDDIPFANVCNPGLTTVHYPIYESGKLAAMLLLENMVSGNRTQMGLSMNLMPAFAERQTVRDITRTDN